MAKNKSNIHIKYIPLGATKQVTGSCHLLKIDVGGKKCNIVIDYGMVQDGLKSMNELYRANKIDKGIKWSEIDYVILTHLHSDHSALLITPFMDGYAGNIICTAPTINFAEILLSDSAFIQLRETERYNNTKEGRKNPIYPIYGQRHVEDALPHFRGYDYNKPIKLSDEVTLTLLPAGHIIGACSPYIEVTDGVETKNLLFTGDISGYKELRFTKKPDYKDLKISYLFTESTYGNKTHKDIDIKKILREHVFNTCIKNKGQLMIPCFAIGRSTLMLSYLKEIFEESNLFNDIPIYLASPMAVKSHKIYGHEDSFNFYNKSDESQRDLFQWSKIEYIEEYKVVESHLLNNKVKIMVISSGMLEGGYSVSVATSVLPNHKNTILFSGYQGIGTTGRNILESELGQTISIDNKNVKRKCNVDFVSASSHADSGQIIEMIKSTRHTKIKKIFLNHGEESVLEEFKEKLENEFKSEIIISDYQKVYNL